MRIAAFLCSGEGGFEPLLLTGRGELVSVGMSLVFNMAR